MAKIPYVEKEHVPENIQGIYDALQQKFGVVPNVIKAMANAPEMLAGFMPYLGAALGPSQVSSDLKELAIITTSKINGCSYCTAHHTAAGKRAGLTDEKIASATDARSAALSAQEQAVVHYATELANNVAASESALEQMRQHFSDSQIAELNMVTGTFQVLTRFADTFKVDLEHG